MCGRIGGEKNIFKVVILIILQEVEVSAEKYLDKISIIKFILRARRLTIKEDKDVSMVPLILGF